MFHSTPRSSVEGPAGPDLRSRRRPLRVVSGLVSAVALCLGGQGSLAAAQPSPESASPTLEARMAALHERLFASQELALAARIDRDIERATERQIAVLLERHDVDGYLSAQIDHRIGEELAALTRGGPMVARRSQPARAESLRLDSGSLELDRSTLVRAGERRVSLRHRFERPFEAAPEVALGVRVLHLPQPGRPQVSVRVLHVDERGFDYEVRAWGEPAAADLTADWVAYDGQEAASPAAPR